MSMSHNIEVAVPDIGDFEEVDVIEVLVKPGDILRPEDPLVTLESEKATMDIPAPQAGRVVAIEVKVGDKVSQGRLILTLAPLETETETQAQLPVPAFAGTGNGPSPSKTHEEQILVPDIGDFEQVDVIDILVKVGDVVTAETPLVTLESEKATMDIPAPKAGRVVAILVKVGDKVSEGGSILALEIAEEAATHVAVAPAATAPPVPISSTAPIATPVPHTVTAPQYTFNSPDPGPRTFTPPGASHDLLHGGVRVYASPAMRKFARELGVELSQVKGTGRKSRIIREDIANFVKQTIQQAPATRSTATGGFTVPTSPVIDFTKFGPIESRPLSKIKRLTGQNLHRAWVSIPHVTQFDIADITDLEAFRKSKLTESGTQGTKLTLVAFMLKAVTTVLKRLPDFNASLSPDGESLIYKKYFHLGVAVNTDRGLLVPVVRDVEAKGIYALAKELGELSTKAREGKLLPAEMQGACFTLTSLGGISGTGFTPIINPPEVAILGISPARMQPVYQEGSFVPRLMLPLSLSYDHRVIDGVAAAEFTRFLGAVLRDIRQILL